MKRRGKPHYQLHCRLVQRCLVWRVTKQYTANGRKPGIVGPGSTSCAEAIRGAPR